MKHAGVSSIVVVVALLAAGMIADAQQPKKIPRLGYLTSNKPAREFARAEAIRLALRERGYIEGQNIAIEYRYGEGKRYRYPELAAELVRLKVDVILVAPGNSLIEAAKNATRTIPIVMMRGSDPVAAGLIESLARPGGNVTGLTNVSMQLAGKQLEVLKEAVPKVTRVAVLYNPALRGNVLTLKQLQTAAPALKLTVQPWEIRDAGGFELVFGALRKERSNGLYVTGSPLMFVNVKRIVDLALNNRLPSVYQHREAVEAGGLMYYGADLADSDRLVAWYVDKILKGTNAADLPVQQPLKFEFVINLNTANQIGVTIPQSVLMRADKVIK